MKPTDNIQPNLAGPLAFLFTALISLVLGVSMVTFHPAFLLTETLTGHGQAWSLFMVYGFALPAVFGAVYWAMPGAFEAPLYSERLVFLHFAFHLAGLLIVLLCLFFPNIPQAAMGPVFLACGALVFTVNIAGTLSKIERPDVSSALIGVSLLWLLVTAFLGTPFVEKAPLPMLEATTWKAGLLVLAIAGVMLNIAFGLALRLAPAVVDVKPIRTQASWLALALMNFGIAWMFAAITFGPIEFGLLCTGIYFVGTIIAFLDFWRVLQRRPSDTTLSWGGKILLSAVSMLPTTAGIFLYDLWTHLTSASADAPVVAPASEDAASAVLSVTFLDWTTAFAAIFGMLTPAIIAVVAQLLKQRRAHLITSGENNLYYRIAEQIQLAAFFNYAVGAGLLLVGVWGGEEKMLSLGGIFLGVSFLGFLVYFSQLLRNPSEPLTHRANPSAAPSLS